MNDFEQRVTTMLAERAAAVTPEPDVDAIVARRGDRTADRRDHRGRWIVLGAAAAAMSLLAVGAVLRMAAGDEDSVVITSETPDTEPPDTLPTPDTEPPDTVPTPDTTAGPQTPAAPSTAPGPALEPTLAFPDEIPEAPVKEGGPGFVIIFERDGRAGLRGPSGEWIPLIDALDDAAEPSFWTEPLGDLRIIDLENWAPPALYIVTCCDPGGRLWRNGAPGGTATRVKYTPHAERSPKFVTVDDVAETLFVGDVGGGWQAGARGQPVPGIVDATGSADGIVALVAGADPHLLMNADALTGSADPPRRIEVPFADQGPCALVTLDPRHLLVLYGTSDGVDRCIGDRAAIVDGTTGELVTGLRLPATSRLLRSNENGRVMFVTPDGAAVEGHFAPRTDGQVSVPVWTTRATRDALAALPPLG